MLMRILLAFGRSAERTELKRRIPRNPFCKEGWHFTREPLTDGLFGRECEVRLAINEVSRAWRKNLLSWYQVRPSNS